MTSRGSGADVKKAAFGVLSLLKDNLAPHSALSIEDEDEIVIASLKRHGHQSGAILDSVIRSLEELLALETSNGLVLDANDRMLIRGFLMEEIKGNGEHGIGFNGLFVAFHCLRSTYNQVKVEPNAKP